MLTVRRAAVLGSPIGHSLSPVMHRAAYAWLGLDGWEYSRREVTEPELADLVAGLDDSWVGLSLTMPLKEEALRVASSIDPVARRVGAANTLVRGPGGGWAAHNTDVHGVRAALLDHGVTAPRRALLLGSGATARSALAAITGLGMTDVVVAVRSGIRPQTQELLDALDVSSRSCRLEDVPDLAREVDLVVDTLPGRSADQVADALGEPDYLPPLFEAIYEGWPTALARGFIAAGAPVASGLEMLAHQAARQVELMTGQVVPAHVLLDAVDVDTP